MLSKQLLTNNLIRLDSSRDKEWDISKLYDTLKLQILIIFPLSICFIKQLYIIS